MRLLMETNDYETLDLMYVRCSRAHLIDLKQKVHVALFKVVCHCIKRLLCRQPQQSTSPIAANDSDHHFQINLLYIAYKIWCRQKNLNDIRADVIPYDLKFQDYDGRAETFEASESDEDEGEIDLDEEDEEDDEEKDVDGLFEDIEKSTRITSRSCEKLLQLAYNAYRPHSTVPSIDFALQFCSTRWPTT